MEIRYFSTKLNKYFDTEEACEKAEKAFDIAEAAKETAMSIAKTEKKAMAKAIEDADEKLTTALTALDAVREDVKKIYAEAAKESEEILEPAKKAVNEAKVAKLKALADFNKKYGTYEVKYSGDKAAREVERVTRLLENPWDTFFRF